MAANAAIIIAVGRSLGVPDHGIVIALAAAMQESSLRNLDYGDRDSLGLFQQRPSAGWGTRRPDPDPLRAARLFFGGPNNPNKGNTRGLLDIAGWQLDDRHRGRPGGADLGVTPTRTPSGRRQRDVWLAELG